MRVHGRAELFKELAGAKHGGMLGLDGDYVLALVRRAKNVPFDRQVVGLAAAALEHDLVGTTAEQLGDLAASLLQRSYRRRSRPMATRWIAEGFVEKRSHGSGNSRIDWRARVVVEIDRCHGLFSNEMGPSGSLSLSRMMTATTVPERNVNTAVDVIAHDSPKLSAMRPAESAPIA